MGRVLRTKLSGFLTQKRVALPISSRHPGGRDAGVGRQAGFSVDQPFGRPVQRWHARPVMAGSCLPMRPQFAVESRSNLPVRHGLRKRPGPISFTSPISRRCPEMRSAGKTEPVAAYAIGLATVQLSKLIATKPAFRTAARGHLRAGTPSPDRTPEGPVHSETCLTAYTGMSANAAVRPCPCISPPSVGLRTLRSSVRRIAASSGNKFALSAMFRTSFSRLGRSCLRS